MEKNRKKSCSGNSRHIDISYFFANSNEATKLSLHTVSQNICLHMFLLNPYKEPYSKKIGDMIMGWKHVDTLQMGPPSKKERVVNVVKVRSNQEEIKSNMETGGERIEPIV